MLVAILWIITVAFNSVWIIQTLGSVIITIILVAIALLIVVHCGDLAYQGVHEPDNSSGYTGLAIFGGIGLTALTIAVIAHSGQLGAEHYGLLLTEIVCIAWQIRRILL